jgi:molybdate transport system substrate-binding protein
MFIRILYFLMATQFASAPTWAQEPVTVSAAISLKPALEAMRPTYEAASGDRLVVNYGSSGALLGQIRAGAPVDLFIAAANKQMDELMTANLGDPATRTDIARGRRVLIVPAEPTAPIAALSDLSGARVRRVAIGQPRTVPAGDYASQALANAGLADAVTPKLVYGANVRQVLDYVARGEADAGLVYATDARDAGEAVRVVATIDAALHEPIVYSAALVTGAPRAEAGRRLLRYLQSEPAQRALKDKGFDPPANPTTAPVPPPTTAGNP